MSWEKKGLIYRPSGDFEWSRSHAQVPLADCLGDRLRVYFGTRDDQNRTTTTFVEVSSNNPREVLYIHDRPVLSLGELGCFDDSGAMPSWMLDVSGAKYLYYIGWNVGVTVPYRNSIGLAVSQDGGLNFERLYQGPLLDRTPSEPYLCATPCVLVESGIWRMWYLSGVGWRVHSGHPEPYYHIKYAESLDGINWRRDGHVCIDFNNLDEGGIARPTVLKDGSLYRMWYSYRGGSDYRSERAHSYRIGYAESGDGLEWRRRDDLVSLQISESGWDSEMQAYPNVIDVGARRYMFHNGNGFGRSGFGYAVWHADHGDT